MTFGEMGLRSFLCVLLVTILQWESEAAIIRQRRQLDNSFPNQAQEPKAYQPPILLSGSSLPVAPPAKIQNSYQPPISMIRSNEYHSPLIPPQNPYPAARSYQPQPVPGSQTYVLPNQPQHQVHSVQYTPPANSQQSFSTFQQSSPNSFPQPATSFSVHQQPLQNSQGQSSFPILSDNSGIPQSTAERTYSTHSKVVGSAHVPIQSIHKTPASEIQPEKTSAAKEKDNKNDEYIVYYYYYYDNDTSVNNNLTLNFDDIPSLESYDSDKQGKEPEKSASARTLSSNVNSLSANESKPVKEVPQVTETSSSQPRSVGDTHPDHSIINPVDTIVQPLKPVSNIFRYGSNEVPRFPVLPNFIVTEVPTTIKPELLTSDTLTSEAPTTQPAQINAQPDLSAHEDADNDLNNVLDKSELKPNDDKIIEEETTTTTTTTTTEPPTTTEEPTTTTERSRRRPSLGGGRRRFNPSSSFSSSRNRQTSSRSTTSTTTTTTTTTRRATPTRRSFQGSRIRPRPPIGSNRPRLGSRTSSASTSNDDKAESKTTEATTASTTTSRSRFTSSAPRRFQSSRSRQTSSTTSSSSRQTSSTRAPSSAISSRSRPSIRPRPSLLSRNRPRPGFLRPRPGSEPEVPETTTATPEEETSPETVNEELSSTNDEENETDEDNETSDQETEEPTTTEGNRFSALFRPRNRNPFGNRPRPVIGNRPSRS